MKTKQIKRVWEFYIIEKGGNRCVKFTNDCKLPLELKNGKR